MTPLRFSYAMELSFSQPVAKHHFTLKCFPPSNERQQVAELHFRLIPNAAVAQGQDGFGNATRYGCIAQPHELFQAEIWGRALTGLSSQEAAGEPTQAGRFCYPTPLTCPGAAILAFYNSLTLSGNNLSRALACMDALYGKFRYLPGATGVHTTAEQAFAQGQGVCQDYAHILLALCRLAKIPCRYIAGLLPGEGESHAWVDIYQAGAWVALDPTHNRRAADGYLQFSAGRDSADCSISRGIFIGQASQSQTVRASAEEET